MRLTLRTLLAYLDDILEPAQARLIGAKAAESESARELMARIEQVTRRRRLTTPPPSGAGAIDANTIAEYLDNAVAPEQAAEVEQICLDSDVHLAEVAACHQILTLVLGEPSLVPPSANQRMYALVKGPESIPFRKPAAAPAPAEIDHPDHKDHDETLRLGMPPVGKGGLSNRLTLIGGGVAAAVLLGVAIWQVLNFTGKSQTPKGDVHVQADTTKDRSKSDDKQSTDSGDKKSPQDQVETDKKGNGAKDADDKDKKKDAEKKTPDMKDPKELPPPPMEVAIPFKPPVPGPAPAGDMTPLPNKEPSLLLQATPGEKTEWRRVQGKGPEVSTGRHLVCLPGSRALVQLHKGVLLTLWGSTPELYLPLDPKQPQPPLVLENLRESRVELHVHDQLDLDMTLHRGRILLKNTKDTPVRVRVRFENPSNPSQPEYFDLTLLTKGSEILMDRFTFFPPGERFEKNSKHPNRLGPTAVMGNIVLAGQITFRSGEVAYTLDAPPGPAVLFWNSARGASGPAHMDALPLGLLATTMPKEKEVHDRKEFFKAREFLAYSLNTKPVDVALEEAIKSTDPYLRVLAIRCRAALDDLPSLLDALDQDKAADLRFGATQALERWIALGRDNDYVLYNLLQARYKAKEAQIVMELLHPFSEKDLQRPEAYDRLLDCLVNNSLVVREVGYYKLQAYVPAGREIPYSATADSAFRTASYNRWRELIPPGRLPLTSRPMKK